MSDGRILVIGGTGATGSEAVRHLVQRSLPVRVVSRDPSRAVENPALRGAELVAGDSSRPETLAEAFRDVEKLYLVPPTHPGWDETQSAMIDMAAAAGVRHAAKLSVFGADPAEPSLILRFHHRGEQEIQRRGIGFTHIRANSFFQNVLLLDAPAIKAQSAFYSCVGDARFAKVDARDIGEVVATVLSEPGHENRTYELTGPDPLTYDDIAAELSRALGREIRYVDMPPDDYAALLISVGVPQWLAEEFATLYGRGKQRAGASARVTSTVEDLLGRPPRSFADWAREHADVLRAA
ncbi:SDR family oxidoreductase [Geodermatophilus sabuli]|uniref:Uncharacterized conserved protein YbjT, contains NAD(P)-binding and DUF2867 domains n=1 Tax=Geodermatophilus sabuli TaxID=1564158 RepID=A0A285EDK9_9ACTN|nr:SDR family oxidoreductase [Geodermatophilus sabuli]MBB3084607.1 uncharacterized protein YbjT (DUF2867 family) [Geodermatophilus sabuli]SNX97199.1 Uncharacterized conserved protein YbjT, contains NAD(P)-binding and DUF2867 domains [Geodermatophilus sabuli]